VHKYLGKSGALALKNSIVLISHEVVTDVVMFYMIYKSAE
jgi:hypothetical protein